MTGHTMIIYSEPTKKDGNDMIQENIIQRKTGNISTAGTHNT